MKSEFKTAKITLRTSNSHLHIMAINGCCDGKESSVDKGEFFKYCGQSFWELISGSSTLYIDIIEPLGHKAKEKNEEFCESYAKKLNIFTREFIQDFCMPS